MSKKVISLLLAVMLAVAMIAVAALSVSADTDDEGRYVPSEGTETYHVYFYKPADWENEYTSDAGIYWWSGSDSPSAWPGYGAHKADIPNVYYCDVPTDVVNVIWNNALDGTDDPINPEYTHAYQTNDITFFGYDAEESEYYPDGVDNFDNMIYVINPEYTSVNDKGKSIFAGEWFYYYGNGEYGTAPTKAELKAGDYYGKDGVFPTEYIPSGEETTAAPTTVVTEPATTELPTDATAATEATSATEDSSLALTVNATSNYFPMASAQYNASTNQVTVTYNFESAKNVLDTQWYISYDPTILSVAEENTVNSVCPAMNGKGAYVNLNNKVDGTGYVRFCASDLSLYNFSEKTPFAKVVFDVKDISKVAPVSTTVDLVVQVLRISELNPDTEMTDSAKEVVLVDKEVVKKDPVASAVKVDLSTELTPSTYVEPTTAEPTTAEPTTVEPTTTGPTEAPTTAPVTTQPATEEPTTVAPTTTESATDAPATEPETTTAPVTDPDATVAPATENPTVAPTTLQNATSATESTTQKSNSTSDTPDTPNNNGNNNGAVQTGEAPLAVVILTLLIGSTCVMFVLRKKENIL